MPHTYHFDPVHLSACECRAVQCITFLMLMEFAGLNRIAHAAADHLRLREAIELSLSLDFFTEEGCAGFRALVTPDLVQRLVLAGYRTNNASLTDVEWRKKMEARK